MVDGWVTLEDFGEILQKETAMSGERNSVKVRLWQERFERFRKSKLTVEQFCREESVANASFYRWKTKLGIEMTAAACRRQKKSEPAATKAPAFQRVHVSSSVAAVTVRLPDGTIIEVGSDVVVAQMVVKQLLGHQRDVSAEPC